MSGSAAAIASAFRTEDGEQHHVSGVYREVVPNEKLVVHLGVALHALNANPSSPC